MWSRYGLIIGFYASQNITMDFGHSFPVREAGPIIVHLTDNSTVRGSNKIQYYRSYALAVEVSQKQLMLL